MIKTKKRKDVSITVCPFCDSKSMVRTLDANTGETSGMCNNCHIEVINEEKV